MKNVLVSLMACGAMAAVAGAYELGRNSAEAVQDPVKVSPELYKVILDNERLRVLDITLKPGAKSPMHSHPDFVVYALSDGKAKFTFKDGKTQDIELKNGQCVWNDAMSHAAENTGQADLHVLNIELKEPKPMKSK
jgi:quercetin dioxygenase-like cupin family protein